jgi:hypothetical protein
MIEKCPLPKRITSSGLMVMGAGAAEIEVMLEMRRRALTEGVEKNMIATWSECNN